MDTITPNDVKQLIEDLENETLQVNHMIMNRIDYNRITAPDRLLRRARARNVSLAYQQALEKLINGDSISAEEATALCQQLSIDMIDKPDSDLDEVQKMLINRYLEVVPEEQRVDIEARLVYRDL